MGRRNRGEKYWAGYLFADGSFEYNLKQGRNPQVRLTSIDKEHIRKFINFAGATTSIYQVNNSSNSVVWTTKFTDKKLFNFCDNHGIVSKIQVSPYLYNSRHFWRGVIDGDGYIGTKNDKRDNGRPRGRICLTNNSPIILIQFKNFASPVLDNCSLLKQNNCYSIGTSSYKTEDLVEKLYKKSKIHLNRKKIIANKIVTL